MDARSIAEEHRRALVDIGWQCGPVDQQGGEWGFTIEARTGLPKQRRSFRDDGQMTIQRMEQSMSRPLDEVDLASQGRCTYCTSVVAMSQRALGDHRVHGGVCPGSGRRVASFNSLGLVVFEAQTFESALDTNGAPLAVGDEVQIVSENFRGKITEISRGDVIVQEQGGSYRSIVTNPHDCRKLS